MGRGGGWVVVCGDGGWVVEMICGLLWWLCCGLWWWRLCCSGSCVVDCRGWLAAFLFFSSPICVFELLIEWW